MILRHYGVVCCVESNGYRILLVDSMKTSNL